MSRGSSPYGGPSTGSSSLISMDQIIVVIMGILVGSVLYIIAQKKVHRYKWAWFFFGVFPYINLLVGYYLASILNKVEAPETNEMKGIGGWLLIYVILVSTGLVLSIIGLIGLALLGTLGSQVPEVVRSIQFPESGRIISILTVIMIIGLASDVLVLIIIFLKKKWAPMVILILLVIGIVVSIVNIVFKMEEGIYSISTASLLYMGIIPICLWIGYFLKGIYSISTTSLLYVVITPICLWIGYFLKSNRVKNTFIN
jgi:MFS family permease